MYHMHLGACGTFMLNSILQCFISWLDETKKKKKEKKKSILIINFLFEIFINSLLEMVKASYFCFKVAGLCMQEYLFWFEV